MAEPQKPAAAKASPDIKPANRFKGIFPYIAIVVCAVVSFYVFYQIFGDPANFEGGDATEGHPVSEPGWRNTFGIIFKGGFVIPIGMTLHLVMWVFVIERMISVLSATGRGNMDVFVKKVRRLLGQGEIAQAAKECDKQKGSVGNVVKAGLRKYQEMTSIPNMPKEQKKVAIQQEIEEATMLELPMLERNLSILATIASLGTLVGLIGTVLGMIRAFSALGAGGAPNAAELSVGISEALVNTALGITTSAFAVLWYNFFTTRIDAMTYRMDEAGYSIVQTFDVRE